jgi:hypothetical protein
MLPNEINDICKAAFINLVDTDSRYHGRTYCYFEPYESKTLARHITIVDKATGYGAVVPLAFKDIPFIDKAIVQRIISRVFQAVIGFVEKKGQQAKPVDYQKNPLRSNGKTSKLEKIVTTDRYTIEVYSWSIIITG